MQRIDASVRKLIVRQFKQSSALLQSYTPTCWTEFHILLTLLRAAAGFSLKGVAVLAWYCRQRSTHTESSIVGSLARACWPMVSMEPEAGSTIRMVSDW